MATMAEAVQTALVGPERKKLKIYDHEFNVKPAEAQKQNNRLVVNGQISHHLAWRPDDQVYYIITIEDAAIKDIRRDIDRGGWAPIAGPIAATVGAYFGVKIPPDKVEDIGRALGRLVDGTWETVAELITVNIATAFQQKELLALSPAVYEHSEYRGRCQILDVGRYDVGKLSFGNDMISSVKVPQGWKVTLYQHAGFRGVTRVLTADTPALPGFNDHASSIVVERTGR